MTGPLDGCRVLVTRERPGELARLLEERGATVVHLPLIAVIEPVDDGAALRAELDRLGEYDWVIVTSPAGAERVGSRCSGVDVRLGAVGTATAAVLGGLARRDVDLVPSVQLAEQLAAAFIATATSSQRVLLAQADRAPSTLGDRLRDAGHDVTTVIAYRTVAMRPEPTAVHTGDAVVFASGSAVESWVDAFGLDTPPIVVAIGPTTASAADRLGLKMTGIAADHSLDGLVSELVRQHLDAAAH